MKFCIYLKEPTERPEVLDRLAKGFTITRVTKPRKSPNGRHWRLYVYVTIS